MRSRTIAVLGVAGIIIAGACSASTEEKAGSNNAAPNSQITSNTSTANGNTAVVTNGMFVPAQSADANTVANANTDANAGQPLDMMKGRLDKMRASGGSSEKVDVAALAQKNARPAPDNSTFTSYLSDAGYEIRTFNAHPQLLKVEKRTDDTGNQTLKIFLRNGRVIQRPGKDIPILSTISADAILATAGITPPATREPAATGPPAAKKP